MRPHIKKLLYLNTKQQLNETRDRANTSRVGGGGNVHFYEIKRVRFILGRRL